MATSGNTVRFLEDGDACYPAMLAAIARARESVYLESYIYESDLVGWRFARALAAAARRGVSVRVQVDAIGSYRLAADLRDHLVGAGVRFHVFNPLRFTGWELITRRNHRKMLVVDLTTAFVGGLNISLDHVPEPLGRSWHDALVQIDGPAATDLMRHKAVSHGADGRVAFLRNRFLTDRFVIRRRYLKAIAVAKRDIAIANAYFLPDRRILAALRKAAHRGVRVRLLFPGLSDVPFVKSAMEAAYARYMQMGLEIREWPGTMLHHKLALFDQQVMCIGSYNLDTLSLRKNLEISAWIDRTPAVQTAVRAFARDWDASLSVQPDGIKLPLWKRFVAWMVMRLDERL